MRWLSLLVAASLLTTAPASAEDDEDDDTEELDEDAELEDDDDGEKEDDRFGWYNDRDQFHFFEWMTFGVGLIGQAGATILDKTDDQTVQGNTFVQNAEYPGFVGVSTGVGPMFELRFFGYVGIEIDILVHSDSGSAELTHTDGNTQAKFDIEISQSTVHVPILFKGALPGEWVTPVVFLGPEIVSEGEAKCEGDCTNNVGNTDYGVIPAGYTAFVFGLGLEINLPIPKADIRIPLSLRGNVNPSVGSTREERAEHTIGSLMGAPNIDTERYRTEFAFQAAGNFGVAAHF